MYGEARAKQSGVLLCYAEAKLGIVMRRQGEAAQSMAKNRNEL